jgi:FkbM family methyltransferase
MTPLFCVTSTKMIASGFFRAAYAEEPCQLILAGLIGYLGPSVGPIGYICMNRQHIMAQILLRSWPFPRGAGRIIDKVFSGLVFEEDTATVRSTDGFEMRIMPNELIGRHIYLTGEFDRTNVEVLCNFSIPGDTLLDVGANVGYVSACFLKNVQDAKVIAVEPQPGILELLKSNLEQFGQDRYKVVPVALSDRDEQGWFEICDRNRGASRLVAEKNNQATAVEMWSGARFFSNLAITQLDLVKLDVEGHEEVVFRACRLAFERLQPRAILFEQHGRMSAPAGPIGMLLHSVGYKVFGIRKLLTSIELVPILDGDDCKFIDYIAVNRKRDIPQKALKAYGTSLSTIRQRVST